MVLKGEDGGAETFGVIGSVLSMVATAGMSLTLLSDANARKRMRPRMLITLAVLDFFYSLFALAFLVNIDLHNTFSLSNIIKTEYCTK